MRAGARTWHLLCIIAGWNETQQVLRQACFHFGSWFGVLFFFPHWGLKSLLGYRDTHQRQIRHSACGVVLVCICIGLDKMCAVSPDTYTCKTATSWPMLWSADQPCCKGAMGLDGPLLIPAAAYRPFQTGACYEKIAPSVMSESWPVICFLTFCSAWPPLWFICLCSASRSALPSAPSQPLSSPDSARSQFLGAGEAG